MGYEHGMQKQILALLDLFHDGSPDQETHGLVTELIADESKWPGAHDLFDLIRRKLRAATKDNDRATMPTHPVELARVYQYAFEELCLKAVFNETSTEIPFDTDSPFWVAGSAVKFARKLGVPIDSVLAVIAPESQL
jgi:hypothetical protein